MRIPLARAFSRFFESPKCSISLFGRGSRRKTAAHFSWNRSSAILVLAAAPVIFLSAASAAGAGPVDITDAWFRALPGKLPAAGYFTATNTTSRDIAIKGAQAAVCGMVMIHQSKSGGGMAGMEMVDKVTVPAGGSVKFAPGGYHLMCTDPKPGMKVGAKVPVVLTLSNGTGVAVAFAVRDAKGK